jgi:hypothetical protein
MQVEATFDYLGVQPTTSPLRVEQQLAQASPLPDPVLAVAKVDRDASINL